MVTYSFHFSCRDQHLLFKRDVPWMRHRARRFEECGDNLCMQALDVPMVRSAINELLDVNSAGMR